SVPPTRSDTGKARAVDKNRLAFGGNEEFKGFARHGHIPAPFRQHQSRHNLSGTRHDGVFLLKFPCPVPCEELVPVELLNKVFVPLYNAGGGTPGNYTRHTVPETRLQQFSCHSRTCKDYKVRILGTDLLRRHLLAGTFGFPQESPRPGKTCPGGT